MILQDFNTIYSYCEKYKFSKSENYFYSDISFLTKKLKNWT